MPQSLACLLVHVIFSTKDREPWIIKDIRPNLHALLATVARGTGCQCYRVGGTADHVHLAVRLTRTINMGEFVEAIKTPSSKWVKTQGPYFRGFAWQRGYGAFSIGPGELGALRKYIDAQEAHHRQISFQDEFLKFLKDYDVEHDERYLWD